MERRESQRKIQGLEKKLKSLEEQNSDLKHIVENQSLNIAHLENEANRIQKENEERLQVLEEKIESPETEKNNFEIQSNYQKAKKSLLDPKKIIKNQGPILKGEIRQLVSSRNQVDNEESVRTKLPPYAESGWNVFVLKFNWYKNIEIEESGWYLRHHVNGDDMCFKLKLLYNGRRIEYSADADHVRDDGEVFASIKNLRPDPIGRVQFKEAMLYNIHWKITII